MSQQTYIQLNFLVSFAGIEYDYFGIGEFWGCKSLFNDFGIQFRYFAYQRASLTGGVAVKGGHSVLSIMTVNTSDPQEFPKLRYSETPLYGHPDVKDSFVCPDEKLIHFL